VDKRMADLGFWVMGLGILLFLWSIVALIILVFIKWEVPWPVLAIVASAGVMVTGGVIGGWFGGYGK